MRLLLLAGMPEAHQIAGALSRDSRVFAIASLAQAERPPGRMRIPMRIGGWGGDAAFGAWLEQERIDAVLDATHAFATRVSERTARICAEASVDYVQFLRPVWVPGPRDRWIFLNREEEAAGAIPSEATVLLTTGRRRLEAFKALADRPVYVRVAERGRDPFPFERGAFLHRPVRVSAEAEMTGLSSLGVDWIVARNSGGAEAMPILEAARRLELPVGMVRRPPQPQVPRIQTVAEALAWVRRRL